MSSLTHLRDLVGLHEDPVIALALEVDDSVDGTVVLAAVVVEGDAGPDAAGEVRAATKHQSTEFVAAVDHDAIANLDHKEDSRWLLLHCGGSIFWSTQ